AMARDRRLRRSAQGSHQQGLLGAGGLRTGAADLLPRAVRLRSHGPQDSRCGAPRSRCPAPGTRRIERSMDLLGPGSEIDGFRLGELMHAGSMASIYRLAGAGGPLPLVIKIPRLGAGERAVNVIAFEVCRMVLGALAQSRHHPTLVAFGDVETTPYLVIEHVEGKRLSDWVQRAPIPPEELAALGTALALALHDLHRQDVVHLDLKPTNVLFRASGEAVLIDFGLAHHSHYPD